MDGLSGGKWPLAAAVQSSKFKGSKSEPEFVHPMFNSCLK
jgi:hypothetical protein